MRALFLMREGLKLVPAEATTERLIERFKPGVVFKAEVKKARNYKHLCKLMSLRDLIFANQEKYASPEQLMAALKVGAGYCDWIELPGPIPMNIPSPRSLDYETLDQEEFEAVYNSIVHYILHYVIPGLNKHDLEREVLNVLAGNQT